MRKILGKGLDVGPAIDLKPIPAFDHGRVAIHRRAGGLLQSVKLATVGREARTKGSEPKALALGIGRKGIFQSGKNAWAADVAVSSQDFAGGIQPVRGTDSFDGLDHITAASVRDEALRRARSHSEKLGDRIGCEFRNLAVELVFKTATNIDEADFLAVLGLVDGAEVLESELPALRFAPPDGGSSSVSEETEADEHAGLVVEVKSGRGNLDCYCSNRSGGICREQAACGLKERQGGSTAEAEQILKESIRAEAEDFGNVAAQARAKIARAGADQERIDARRFEGGEIAGFEKRLRGESWRVLLKVLMQLPGIAAEGLCQIRIGEPPRLDARISGKNLP